MPKRRPKFRKVTFNLDPDDMDVLKRHYGAFGNVRAAVRNNVKKLVEKIRLMEELNAGPRAGS